ncbi:hypothetical protein JTE90_007831 [Oedothorax gibbosus]|uniref:Uncharacterized protein n=1 Tax=Oedothorax gibbosus TaxID=931172 RepID=A0AAV6VH51_9ARAC|nr:hypothetical protein JTE90_007831 [Oedothorax gibbosus]
MRYSNVAINSTLSRGIQSKRITKYILISLELPLSLILSKCPADPVDLTALARSADAAQLQPSALPAANATLAAAARGTKSASAATASAAVHPSAKRS